MMEEKHKPVDLREIVEAAEDAFRASDDAKEKMSLAEKIVGWRKLESGGLERGEVLGKEELVELLRDLRIYDEYRDREVKAQSVEREAQSEQEGGDGRYNEPPGPCGAPPAPDIAGVIGVDEEDGLGVAVHASA